MEAVFSQLTAAGKNDVDSLSGWMKDAKITENDDQLKSLFSGVDDPKNVPLDKFKEILTRFATEHKKTLEELIQKLLGAAPEFMKTAAMGAMEKLTNAL